MSRDASRDLAAVDFADESMEFISYHAILAAFPQYARRCAALRDRLTHQIFVPNVIPLIRPEFLSPWLYRLLTDAP